MLQELYDKQVKTSIRECKGAMQNPTIYTPNVIDEEMKCIKKHLNEIDAEQRIQNSEIDTLKCGNFDNIKVADTLKVDKIESFSTGTVTFVDPVNITDLTVENFHIQCFCADDTKKFAGQDCDQWKDIIDNSCVADTCKFSGLSCTEWKDVIKTTCVDNANNTTCFDNKTYGQVCEDILSSIPPQPYSGEIDVYCGDTCKCTINCENPLVLSENAFNEYAKIDTETYPGAYCTGTVVESDIQDFITMAQVDACGYTTCVGTVTSVKACLNGNESNAVTENGTLALDITPSLCFSSTSRKICSKLGNKTSNAITLPAGINCTGTLVASDIADFITMSDVDACGYTTCTGTVTQVKVGTNEYNPTNGVICLPDYPPDLSSCPGLDCTGDVTTAQLNAVSNRVTTIEDKIPSQASSTNQLADKDFVNSSIETNTATFRGTFNSVADLEAYTGPKDNNDYAFVVTFNAATSSYQYDRYKYNGTSWVFEYTINTTGFTAEQLAALNSGITDTLVAKITDVYNCKICIQKNNTCIDSFTLNQSSNKSINITVPTKTSDITNDCSFTSCTGTVTGVTLNNCAFTGTGALSATIKPSLCYTSADRKLYTKLGNQTSSAVTLPSGINCTGTLTGVSLNGSSFAVNDGIASLTDFKPATAGTADNSTCFNGCTYAQACTNIRSGLCNHDCLVKLSLLCSNVDRRILFSAQENGAICPVYASNGASFTYNPSNGNLKIGDFSCDCCNRVYIGCNSGLVRSGSKGSQTNGFVVYKESNCLDNCSIGVGIGSGNVNRGFFDYCKASETATSPTFRWLQYWNADREIHALPIWGELGADNKVVYSCVAPVPSNTKRYVLVCFDKTCTCNPSQSSAYFEIEDYSSKYFVWIDVSNSVAQMRTYWQTNGIDPNGNAYGSFCAALPDTTSNGNCFWITYGGYRAPVIKSIRKISIICNTTTAPSGITFTAPTNRNSYTNVYCGTTCLCTLQGPANLCLGSLAFSSATIPTVNNSTIKIQKNSTNVGSFTLNQATGATIDISVPTKTSEITNDSNFITMANVDACGYTTCTGTLVASDIADMATCTWVNSKNYCTHDCLVKHVAVTSNCFRNVLTAYSSAVSNSICPVTFSTCCPLQYNACTGFLCAGSLCYGAHLTQYRFATITNPNSAGWPVIRLLFDVTDWYNSPGTSASNVPAQGINGNFKSYRYGGYASVVDTDIYMYANYGRGTSASWYTDLSRFRLEYKDKITNNVIPILLNDTVNNKYWLALCFKSYNNVWYRFDGMSNPSSWCSTWLCTTSSDGDLPTGWTLAREGKRPNKEYFNVNCGDTCKCSVYTNGGTLTLSPNAFNDTAINSTCFNGCTYANACTDIRAGLCNHDCLVKLADVATCNDRALLQTGAGFVAGCICPVYKSGCSPLMFNAVTGGLKVGSTTCDGYVESGWYYTCGKSCTFAYPKSTTNYVLLGCFRNIFSRMNELELGFSLGGSGSAQNTGTLKILPGSSSCFDLNNIELKMTSYAPGSRGITGIGFIADNTAYNCWVCVVARVVNTSTGTNYSWPLELYRNRLSTSVWKTNFQCLGPTAPTFTKFIAIPQNVNRNYYYNSAICSDFSNTNMTVKAIANSSSCPYILKCDVDTCISDMATCTWVNNQGFTTCTGTVTGVSLNGNAFTINNGAATLTGFKPATASLADCSTYVKRNVLASTTDAYYPLVLSNASTASNKASLYTPQASSVSYNAKQSTLKTYCFETQYIRSDNIDTGFAGQSTSVFVNSCYCALDNTIVVRDWTFCGKDGYLWGNVCGSLCGDAQNAKAISRHIAGANTTYDLLLTNEGTTADCTNVYVSSGGVNCTLKYDTGTHILSVTNISACCVCTPNLVTDNLTVCCGLNFRKPICAVGACIFTSAYNCCQNKPIWPTIETDSSIRGKRWEFVNNGQCCTCVWRIAGVFGIQPMIICNKAKQCDVFAAIQDTGIIDAHKGSYGILGNAWSYCVSDYCHHHIDNIYFGTDDDDYISFRTVNTERFRVYAECTSEVDWNADFISFNRYADIWF